MDTHIAPDVDTDVDTDVVKDVDAADELLMPGAMENAPDVAKTWLMLLFEGKQPRPWDRSMVRAYVMFTASRV